LQYFRKIWKLGLIFISSDFLGPHLFLFKKTFIMKKTKIMLLSFALLAILGGALAFKAKVPIAYCTADLEPNAPFCKVNNVNKACPNRVTLSSAAGTPRFTYCYTTPVAGRQDCLDAAGGNQLLCTTPTTSFKTVD
jgi:hypothetical protein